MSARLDWRPALGVRVTIALAGEEPACPSTSSSYLIVSANVPVVLSVVVEMVSVSVSVSRPPIHTTLLLPEDNHHHIPLRPLAGEESTISSRPSVRPRQPSLVFSFLSDGWHISGIRLTPLGSHHPAKMAPVNNPHALPPRPSAAHLPCMGTMRSRGQLLQLCDEVRASLRDENTLGPRAKALTRLLKDLLHAERSGEPGIDLVTIKYAHLDKLIAELHHPDHVPQPLAEHEHDHPHAVVAESLEKYWQKRFRAGWFELDDARLKALSVGRLKDIDYCEPHKDALERWRASSGGGDPASDIDFDTGE